MHRKPKSHRHQMAAMSRWHRAERDRAEGIHDRAPYTDCRLPIVLDLTSYGGPFPARYRGSHTPCRSAASCCARAWSSTTTCSWRRSPEVMSQATGSTACPAHSAM